VRRRRPDVLYRLWFYVTVPQTEFETPRVHSEVEYRGAGAGSDRLTPFLTVDYSVGLLLDDEMILRGRVVDNGGALGDQSWNYSVQPVNQSHSHRSNSMYGLRG